jgi:hypothetical protein
MSFFVLLLAQVLMVTLLAVKSYALIRSHISLGIGCLFLTAVYFKQFISGVSSFTQASSSQKIATVFSLLFALWIAGAAIAGWFHRNKSQSAS